MYIKQNTFNKYRHKHKNVRFPFIYFLAHFSSSLDWGIIQTWRWLVFSKCQNIELVTKMMQGIWLWWLPCMFFVFLRHTLASNLCLTQGGWTCTTSGRSKSMLLDALQNTEAWLHCPVLASLHLTYLYALASKSISNLLIWFVTNVNQDVVGSASI